MSKLEEYADGRKEEKGNSTWIERIKFAGSLAILAGMLAAGYWLVAYIIFPFANNVYQSTAAVFGSRHARVEVCIRDKVRRHNDRMMGKYLPRRRNSEPNIDPKVELFILLYRRIEDIPLHVRFLSMSPLSRLNCVDLLRGSREWAAARRRLADDWEKNAPEDIKRRTREQTERWRAMQRQRRAFEKPHCVVSGQLRECMKRHRNRPSE